MPTDHEKLIVSIAIEAIDHLGSFATIQRICSTSAYWMSIGRMYAVMIEHKTLPPLSSLDREMRARYWRDVCAVAGERPKWVKVMMCQAVYQYEHFTIE